MTRRLALMVLLAIGSAPARADSTDVEIARAHFATGLTYYDSDRFEPAVKEFLEAYRLSPRPALLYNIARTYEKLDDPGRASAYLRRYLAAEPHAIEAAEVNAKLAALAPRVGTLVVHSRSAGVELLIDDQRAEDAASEPQPLTAGQHEVEVRREGALPAHARVTIVAGQRTTVDLDPIGATPTRARWVWPTVGVGAAVAVGVAVLLIALLAGGTDWSAAGRASCTGSCVLIDVMSGLR